ncbi:MAG: aminopeptidase [Paracoccaceae bacterium]
MTNPIDPAKLDLLAELAIRTGLNLQEGQDLILTGNVNTLPLVRRVVAAAYKAGARVVTPILSDDEITLAKFKHGHDAAFDAAPAWLYDGMASAYAKGAARLAILGDNPMLLAAQDSAKVSRAGKANAIAYKPAGKHITNFDINWSIIAYPGLAWARQMFPDLDDNAAVAKLADAIFAAARVDSGDPVAAWAAHNANLRQRTDWLNAKRFSTLHFTGPGTDLRVGLADDHLWAGGSAPAKNGVTCNPNIPTEEVFTTPHAQRVDGVVRASKPLSHQGSLIENIEVRFEAGRIVESKTSTGQDVFTNLINTDEGAARLGEVALVPHSSPISQSGLLFYNTLFDENAACHIALGQCYSECIKGGANLSDDEISAKGGNSSLIHVDWMIGSGETDIDGIDADGSRIPVFRKGEWAQ